MVTIRHNMGRHGMGNMRELHTHLSGQAISVHPTIPSLQVLEERKEPMTCVQGEMQCVVYQVLQPSEAGKDAPFSYTMPSYS